MKGVSVVLLNLIKQMQHLILELIIAKIGTIIQFTRRMNIRCSLGGVVL